MPIEPILIQTPDDPNLIQAIAEMEKILQPHDFWDKASLADLLEDKHNTALLFYDFDQNNFDEDEANLPDFLPQTQPPNRTDLIGYCLYRVVFEQAEILRIGTLPAYQRQGVARRLLETLFERLQNLANQAATPIQLFLEVRSDNLPALNLYQKQGFIQIDRRKNYYHDPTYHQRIDALILQKQIEPNKAN